MAAQPLCVCASLCRYLCILFEHSRTEDFGICALQDGIDGYKRQEDRCEGQCQCQYLNAQTCQTCQRQNGHATSCQFNSRVLVRGTDLPCPWLTSALCSSKQLSKGRWPLPAARSSGVQPPLLMEFTNCFRTSSGSPASMSWTGASIPWRHSVTKIWWSVDMI